MKQGVDYLESFSIGARLSSVKIIFALTAVYDLFDFQLDVRGAYLLAAKPTDGVGSTTYVHQPQGFEEFGPNGEQMVGVLNTYVYGDPAAGRAWMIKFNGILSSLGAISCDLDPNYFRIEHTLGRIIFAKHVDELIGAATTEEARDWLHEAVAEHVPASRCSARGRRCSASAWCTTARRAPSR